MRNGPQASGDHQNLWHKKVQIPLTQRCNVRNENYNSNTRNHLWCYDMLHTVLNISLT